MRQFLSQCRIYFFYAGLFSLFINVLMLTLPLYMIQLFSRVFASRSLETLTMLSLAAAVIFILHAVLEFLRTRLLLGAGIALDSLAGPPVLTGVLDAAVKPGTKTYADGLRDVATLRGFLTGSGITALFDAPWVPIFIFVIFLFHSWMGILALTATVVLFSLAFLNEKLTRAPLDAVTRETRLASRYIDAGVRNAEVVSAMGMRDNLTRRWQALNARVIDAQVRAGEHAGTLKGITRYLRLNLQILMMVVGSILVLKQHVSSGVMIAGTLILGRALAPVEAAIVTWKGFVDAREAYGKLVELLKESPKSELSRTELPRPTGRLEVDRISYGIPGKDRLIIKGVSLALAPGEAMGLIGPSAAGKSTLARLITGVWRPNSGVVRLDGADVSTWPREHLGPYIGYLPQDVELFGGTVGENIARLGVANSEDIIDAAQRAHAHDMILRLPEAYDTDIGTAGAQLSAGQRQRVALARALFGRPSFVVLDEPNANLDTEGEEALVETLRMLADEGVTVVTISHRPSILAHVHKLLVLKDGQVEMFGPRAEVLARVTPRGIQAAKEAPPVRLANQ